MNTDVEDLLREGMERFTADLRAPAGLTQRAMRRRRRRLAVRSGAAVTTALAAGIVALALVVLPGANYDGTAAAVVKRVDTALSAADPGQIAQVTVTTQGANAFGGPAVVATAEEWSYGGQWRVVTHTAAGQLIYDEGFSAKSGYTLVNYQAREWARQPGLGRPVGSASDTRDCLPVSAGSQLLFTPGLPGLGFSVSSPPATVAKALRTAVSCGTLTVAGRQRVDGIEAIELTSRPGSGFAETIWVNPGTYLPVRVVTGAAARQPVIPYGGGAFPLQQTANFTWLEPTTQNLANLTVPIPAGFRHVALAKAVTPIVVHLPNEQLPRAAARPPLGFQAGPSELPTAYCLPSRLPIRPGGTGPDVPLPVRSMLAIPRLRILCPEGGS
jgi:hypothetical protein